MPRKSKTRKNARRATRAKRSSRPQTNNIPRSFSPRAICAITDPFCNASDGSKWPDQASGRTLAWRMEYFANISTNADGHGAVIFSPDPKTGYSAAATWTGQVINSINPTVTYPGWSNFAAATGVQYRVVSFGVEARSILPAMSNQGSLGIINLP